MEHCLQISGSIPASSAGVILFARPDSVTAKGQTRSGEEVLLVVEPQQGCLLRPWGGIVVLNNPVPQGQTVVRTVIPRQGAKKKMCSELERFIDRVIVPILVARYINRNKPADRVEPTQ